MIELEIKADDIGKYLAYGLSINLAGYYKESSYWGISDFRISAENCLYLPRALTLYAVHYPDSISNQYLSYSD